MEGQNKHIRKKINLHILVFGYILAFFIVTFLEQILPAEVVAPAIPAGATTIITIISAPEMIILYIIIYSGIAWLLFSVWLLLQKLIFKNISYTEKTLSKIRKLIAILLALAFIILVMQSMRY